MRVSFLQKRTMKFSTDDTGNWQNLQRQKASAGIWGNTVLYLVSSPFLVSMRVPALFLLCCSDSLYPVPVLPPACFPWILSTK